MLSHSSAPLLRCLLITGSTVVSFELGLSSADVAACCQRLRVALEKRGARRPLVAWRVLVPLKAAQELLSARWFLIARNPVSLQLCWPLSCRIRFCAPFLSSAVGEPSDTYVAAALHGDGLAYKPARPLSLSHIHTVGCCFWLALWQGVANK